MTDRSDAPPGRARRNRWRETLVAIVWLVLVWNLLWAEFSWSNLLGGLVVALIVLMFFPLPSAQIVNRLRPVALLSGVLRFFVELVLASIRVAWIAIRPGHLPRSAIIAVPVRVRTDLNLTAVAEVLSLIPGTLIVAVDRESGTLYVHVLDVHGFEDVACSRKRIALLERRIVGAVGSQAELRLVMSSDREGDSE